MSDNFSNFLQNNGKIMGIVLFGMINIISFIILGASDINNSVLILALNLLICISFFVTILLTISLFVPITQFVNNLIAKIKNVLIRMSVIFGHALSNYKMPIAISFSLLITGIMLYFFAGDIIKNHFNNYGNILFDLTIFAIFLYLLYGIKHFFVDTKIPTFENNSTFKYFSYYYLFPILFFVGYIIYYIYIYKNKNLSYSNYNDYRVIIYNILTGMILLYILFKIISKILTSTTSTTFSTTSPMMEFFKHIWLIIPCIFNSFGTYLLSNPIYGLALIGFSLSFILFIVFLTSGTIQYDDWYVILGEIVGGIVLISIVIKLILSKTSLGENKIFKLLQKTILLLPCLFLQGFNSAFKGSKFGTASEFLFIVLVGLFLLFYKVLTTAIMPDLYKKYILQNGIQLFNLPNSLDKYKFISSSIDLKNNSDTSDNNSNSNLYDYRYGLSFWVYLNSFAQSDKLYNVCCLGDGLIVKYNPVKNCMYFMYKKINTTTPTNTNTMTLKNINDWKKNKQAKQKQNKQNKINKTTTEEDEIIIYKHENVLFQKWNNIIVNYYGGTMDIFINGNLVKSNINVVPYIKNTAITIGEDNGIKGDIANMMYYKTPITKTDVYRIYNILKTKNPPTIDADDVNILTFGDTLKTYLSEIIDKIK